MSVSEHDLELPAAPGSVADARRFVGDQLVALGAPSVSEVAALLTSELVTNAIVHAGGGIRVRVTRHSSTIRVSVEDASRVVPQRRQPAAGSVTGRGLGLVEQLAERWGVDDEGAGPGKTVWFELRA